MAERRRERKVVSVLFADLVGFTARAESLDPEDVEALLGPYHDRLRSELEQRGGTVEKFIGDAVMAVFGAPVAHEDDAERAVRAALAIRDWIREEGELEVRIAVNTGEALVSFEPSRRADRGLVAGDVVNTASRLQSAAPVNGIFVGETTYNATSRVIAYRDVPPVEAKGKAEPVPVWEVVEARSRYGSDVTRVYDTPLVGREHERDVLVRALAHTRRERSPQLVTLLGVPGIGKSRLVHELFRHVDEQPDLVYWRQGRCLPYGEGAFWALGEIVKAHAGILEGESQERAAEKLEAVVEEAVTEPDDGAWVLRQLRPLIGLADGGEAGGDRRTETFAAWRRFFEGLAELGPLVLVFEDLHWADDGLLEFVDHLVDWAAGVPILVVTTARPELLTRRPDWGGGKPNATAVSLSPLSAPETATLVHRLLDRAVLPATVQEALLDRAGGNPLYAEEFARIARERGGLTNGATELPLPETVQGLIAARLDALSGEEKSLLHDASVIGKVFWLGAAAALAGESDRRALAERLHELERKQFIRRERRSSVGGDTQHAFVHGLVREVAYSQIPRAERAEKHRRAGLWIESLGRPEDHAELLAHHYVSALEIAQATGRETPEVLGAARRALREAGDRALALGSFEHAARHYDRALAWWPEDDPQRARLQFSAARARFEHGFSNDEELAAARDALLAVGDREGAAEAQARLINVHWVHGRGNQVHRDLERLVEMAEPLPLSPTKALVYSWVSRFHMVADRHEEGRAFGEEALAMAQKLGLDFVRGYVLGNLGVMRALEGDRGGLEQLEQSIEILGTLNAPDVVRSYNNLMYTLFRLGELDRVEELALLMDEAAERWGSPEWLRWAWSQRLELAFERGRWEEATDTLDRLVGSLLEGRQHYLEAVWRTIRSRMHAARGDDARAEEDASVAVEVAREGSDPQVIVPALAWRAVQLQAIGAPDVRSLATELLRILHAMPPSVASSWFADVAIVLSGLGWQDEFGGLVRHFRVPTPWRDGSVALAAGDYARAAEVFAAMGASTQEAEARLRGARAGVDADLAKAIAFFRQVGASARLAEAESLLATSRSA